MKKIMTIMVIILAVFLIYLGLRDDKIYYLAMGDYLTNGTNGQGFKDYGYADYIKDSIKKLEKYVNISKDNYRIIDIISDIDDNISINVDGKYKTVQNALIKADLVTISIGMNDLISNVTLSSNFNVNDLYTKLEQVVKDYENLFKVLRKYCKEEIYLIGVYNTMGNNMNDFFDYADNKIATVARTYKIKYVSAKELTDYLDNKMYPSKQGHELIANKVINMFNVK